MAGRALLVLFVALGLVLVSAPWWWGRGSEPPEVKPPVGRGACVMSREEIRREHPALLSQWRDAVVRDGQTTFRTSDGRDVPMSLSGTCLGCHTEPSKFCDRCHDWVGVKPGCFGCHVRPAEGR